MNREISIVLTTCPSADVAEEISKKLVKNGSVKCAQILGEIRSFYIWKENFYSEKEVKLAFKLKSKNCESAKRDYFKMHPYECPEWVELSGLASEEYARWVNEG